MTVLIKYPYETKEVINNFILRKQKELTGEDFAKWAGWMDTDGAISKGKNSKKVSVVLSLKDKSPVELFSKIFETSLCYREGKTRPPKYVREMYPHMQDKIYTSKIYNSRINSKDKVEWVAARIYPYLLKPEKKDYVTKVLGYTPESKNLSDWTRQELINYVCTAIEGDGGFELRRKSMVMGFYSSDSEYVSLMKYILEEKLNLPEFNLYERHSYNTLQGERTKYALKKCFSQKSSFEYNDFLKEMIEAMTMDRKKQMIIDYLKINEVE